MSEERPTGWEEADRWFSDDAGGGTGGEDPPPVPRCEVCGAELEPDQTYCLECGSPTALAPRLRRGGRAVALLAGAIVVLGLGAGALAYAVASDDDGGGGSTSPTAVTAPTATAPVVPPPPTGPLPPDTSFTTPTAPTAPTDTAGTVTGFPTVTGPTTTAPTTTGTTAATEPTPPATTTASQTEPDTGSSDWPAGETAWTAVLSSVRSESDARAAKSRLAATGEPAGVLFSSDYPGLQPGYWVLFSGSYPAKAEAEAQASSLSSDWPGAYARRIEG